MKQLLKEKQICALCSCQIKKSGYLDGPFVFCCAGCQAVYQILSSQQALANFTDHPLFQQALRSGLISNPDLIEQMSQRSINSPDEDFQKIYLEIREMWCPACAQVISLILLQEKGVRECVVDYSTDLASIEYSPRYLSKASIFCMIEKLGYHPTGLQDEEQKTISRSLYLRFILAAFFSANLMMFAYPIYASYFDAETIGYAHLFAWLSGLGAIPVVTYSSWPIWRRLWTGIRVGIWGMEALVFLGVMTAFGLSLYELFQGSSYVYFDSLTVIITFVLLGKIIESRAKFSAKDSLLRLMRGLPKRGRKKNVDGSEIFVPIKEIAVGEHIVVLSGERIVVDGVVEEGEGACDESLVTGESLPIAKKIGATMLAGTLLQQGRLLIKVTAKPEESALQRIIAMVEQEIGHKSTYIPSIDRIVKWFVPLVLILAISTAIYCWIMGISDAGSTVTQTAIIRAISVLLISCPCAIGIAVPLAESHILNAFSTMGALVRNRACLTFFGRETVFVFDKTGTVTEGKFKILSGLESLDFELKTKLKGLVIYSNHPIAVAIHKGLYCLPAHLDHVEEVIGQGIQGYIGKDKYFLGSFLFLQEQGISLPSLILNNDGIYTSVFFAVNQTYLTCIELGDCLKTGAQATIAALKPIQSWLVSGDALKTVQNVANRCGFDQWHAEFSPLQKKELVQELREKGEVIVMLGDGINDAPALAAAHIGIAVISATDTSIQVSDILLTTDQLQVIPRLRQIAVKGHRIIKQNLFWAFFYNIVGMGLAMNGNLTPIFAAFAMVTSSLIVLLNAQRIGMRKKAT